MENVPRQSPSTSSFPAIDGDHWIETLSDGSQVLIRPLRADDRERESDFIKRLSPETRHFRFFGTMREASPALLDQLMKLDYHKTMVFVALAYEDDELREVGVSRYGAASDAMQCECAITVADNWHHRGLAVTLMRHLIDRARRNGLRQMFALADSANEPMHELARYLGFRAARDPDGANLVIHTLDL